MTVLKPSELALVLAAVLGMAEILTGTFVFLGFSLGCLAVAGVEAWSGMLGVGRDTAVFAAVALLTITVLRRVFGRRGDSKQAEGDVNDY